MRVVLLLLCVFVSAVHCRYRALFPGFKVGKELDQIVGSLVDTLDRSTTNADNAVTTIKVLYPATNKTITPFNRAPKEGNSFPIVLFFSGGLISSDRYQWLGEKLVLETNVVFVTFNHITEFNHTKILLAGELNAPPSQESAVIVGLKAKLIELNKKSILAGRLDLDRIVVGGHSLGGVFALFASNKKIIPAIKGVFTYGSQTAAGPGQELPPATILPIPGLTPLLLLAGTRDGIVQSSGPNYGTEWKNATEPVRRTFFEALKPNRQACYIEVRGSSHMEIVDPEDHSLTLASVDFKPILPKKYFEFILSNVVSVFIQNSVDDKMTTKEDYYSSLPWPNFAVRDIMCKP